MGSSVDLGDSLDNEAQKIVAYVMPDRGANGPPGHKFMVLRRTTKNAKGRYVTAEEFAKFGLFWPNSFVKTREELATRIGEAILDEVGIIKRVRHFVVTCDFATSARAGAAGTFQVLDLIELDEDDNTKDMTHLVDQGIHFENLERLRRYLAQVTRDEVELEDSEGPESPSHMRPEHADEGEPEGTLWDRDSEWYHVGMLRGPDGGVWADKAIRARGSDRARAYARKALDTNRDAWSAWFSAFTGTPVP